MKITDIKNMPGFNSYASNEIDSVSKGKVDLSHKGKPTCYKHDAMLCVCKDRKIWRCPTCNVGCYVTSL